MSNPILEIRIERSTCGRGTNILVDLCHGKPSIQSVDEDSDNATDTLPHGVLIPFICLPLICI
jgi:hypothetical protein